MDEHGSGLHHFQLLYSCVQVGCRTQGYSGTCVIQSWEHAGHLALETSVCVCETNAVQHPWGYTGSWSCCSFCSYCRLFSKTHLHFVSLSYLEEGLLSVHDLNCVAPHLNFPHPHSLYGYIPLNILLILMRKSNIFWHEKCIDSCVWIILRTPSAYSFFNAVWMVWALENSLTVYH